MLNTHKNNVAAKKMLEEAYKKHEKKKQTKKALNY